MGEPLAGEVALRHRTRTLILLAGGAAGLLLFGWKAQTTSGTVSQADARTARISDELSAGADRVTFNTRPQRGASQRASGDAGTEPGGVGASVRALILELTGALEQALSENADYLSYIECAHEQGANAAACRLLKTAAFYFVVDATIGPMILERMELIQSLIRDFGEGAVTREIVARLTDNTAETERLTMLTLATREPLRPAAYPAHAYARIEHVSVPEQTMLLAPHESIAIENTDLIGRVAVLATDATTDLRTRRAAIKGLGHDPTAEALDEVIRTLRTSPVYEGVWRQVGEALARCGSACVGTVQELARGPHRDRMVAYEAVLTSAPGRARALQEAIERTPLPGDADPEERATRDHVLRLGRAR